ncbi:MAG: hypothetical protein QOC56_265, partial [Alphaproteobacteria bacterium]|nr:hypothetical protein [Alphaproteobacteria bacterium]
MRPATVGSILTAILMLGAVSA